VTIKAAATSLRSGEVAWDSPVREELLAALEEEADRLNQFVGDLLNMSRIEAGALKLQRQWNILEEIVDTTLNRMRPQDFQHHLEVNVADDLPLVPVDAVLMQQVFANLIGNSLKYAPPDTTVRVNASRQGADCLLVEVINEGPPVSEEHLEHIFDKFHRVTEAEHVPGTGLGLSICKGIIEAHGGRIWAENLPGGFAFKLTLPLAWEGMSPPRLPAKPEDE
jgi:two-component system sensor histidine kinase KdpD